MINIQNLDNDNNSTAQEEKEFMKLDPALVTAFYSRTGDAKKDYVIKMAQAEAERIRIVRQAQAEGLLMIRRAEAEGFKLIGEVLASSQNPELVTKLAGLVALQSVAQSLGDGKATKIFLPQNMGDIFSLIGGWSELKDIKTEK